LVQKGALSPADWRDALRARISNRAAIKAWAHLGPGLTAAPRTGSLAGLPIGVKDVIDVAGMPTECNSAIDAGRIATADAEVVARLVAAGAVMLGKTKTTEYAFVTPTDTVNPHDPSRTPGGSSSGSAAAVADFQVPVALTTQTGGSTIRPAAYCGIVGYKPPFGYVPNQGLHFLSPGFDTIGLHARNVEDIRIVAEVAEARRHPPGRAAAPRFAMATLPGEISDDTRDMLEAARATLSAEGAVVRDIDLQAVFASLDTVHRVVLSYDMARIFAGAMREEPVRLSDPMADFVRKGATHSTAVVSQAYAEIARARNAMIDLLEPGELLLCPAAPGIAPKGLASTGSSVFNRPFSLLHCAAMTIPAQAGAEGLPLGLQIVDPRPSGLSLFPAASFVEAALESW
jgi:Asp-tRNA(Asn)/Glu-tRNA(Gln) amidotransferase A subunit family amidase